MSEIGFGLLVAAVAIPLYGLFRTAVTQRELPVRAIMWRFAATMAMQLVGATLMLVAE